MHCYDKETSSTFLCFSPCNKVISFKKYESLDVNAQKGWNQWSYYLPLEPPEYGFEFTSKSGKSYFIVPKDFLQIIHFISSRTILFFVLALQRSHVILEGPIFSSGSTKAAIGLVSGTGKLEAFDKFASLGFEIVSSI